MAYTWWFLQGPQKINFLLLYGLGPQKGPYGPQSGGAAEPHTPWHLSWGAPPPTPSKMSAFGLHGTPGGRIGPFLLTPTRASREADTTWVSRQADTDMSQPAG